jgi:hypothetical protein
MALVGLEELRERAEGRRQNGTVTLRDFDRGIVETLGGEVWYSPTSKDPDVECDPALKKLGIFPNYFVQVEGVSPPAGLPGVPVTWSFPEDLFERYQMPVFWVSRESLDPAMNRWHPGSRQYRAPSKGALPVVSGDLSGWSSFDDRQQAVPYDLAYVLNIENRQEAATRNNANVMFMYAIRRFQPYAKIGLFDSIGDIRTYDCFFESSSNLDETQDVTKRKIGFTLNLRVEGELDLTDDETKTAVTDAPVFNLSQT